MEKKVLIIAPTFPDYIRYTLPQKPKSAGFDAEAGQMAVGGLTEREANEYADLVKETFLNTWRIEKAKVNSDNFANSTQR